MLRTIFLPAETVNESPRIFRLRTAVKVLVMMLDTVNKIKEKMKHLLLH